MDGVHFLILYKIFGFGLSFILFTLFYTFYVDFPFFLRLVMFILLCSWPLFCLGGSHD